MFIATLATNLAQDDINVFFKTLAMWNTLPPTVYLYTDDKLIVPEYPGRIVQNTALNKYSGLTRKKMEQMSSEIYSSLWLEFQAEKLNLLDWALATTKGVFYFDADICFLGPLPTIPPSVKVALSPHMIRQTDEAKFGKYNAGFLWVKDKTVVEAWREACPTSRFFEQAALECFDGEEWKGAVYLFPVQFNYGWWRMWQGKRNPVEIIKDWSMQRDPSHSGILVENAPLCSIHTHWNEKYDRATYEFNRIVLSRLETLGPFHSPAQKLFEFLSKF